MATTSTVYSSKPAPISSNPVRRRSINPNTGASNIDGSSNNIISKDMEENVKSRPLSLTSSEWKQIIIGKLDEYEKRLRQNKRVILIEDKYLGNRFPLSYVIASLLLFSIISIIYIFSGMRSLSTIVGVMYPFYQSLKVLNVHNVNDMNKHDLYKWLSYWIWYGIFTTFENFGHFLFGWMGNVYEIMKMALFVYLYHPQTKGSLFLYHKILQPLVIQLINYEYIMLENVSTLKKNITISEQEGGSNSLNDYQPNMTNTSANTSTKSFSSNNMNLGSKNPPLNMNTSPINPNAINTSNIPSTFVPFQPMAFAATTPLNTSGTNVPLNPVISATPINTSNLLPPNSNNVTPAVQNNLNTLQ